MKETGVGLRANHFPLFVKSPPKSVSWVEVISENYMAWEDGFQGYPIENLEKVRCHLPVMLHGVSLSIGSKTAASKTHLRRLKDLVQRIEPEWISDHLCWTNVDNENLHDLLPLPYTKEAIGIVVDRIQRAQDFLGQRILIENISSYITFPHSEMTEWEFLREILKKADCMLLLDINNIYVSATNHGFDPRTYLKNIPFERVRQIHLAGHSHEGDVIIDTHSTPVIEPVWQLFEETIQTHGPIHSMIERDANIPEWEILEQEVLRIDQILKGNYVSLTPRNSAAL